MCRVLIWVVGLEAQDEVAVRKDGNGVTAHGNGGEIGRVAVVDAGVWGRSCDDLKLMAVEMERVGFGVEIVDHYLDDFVVLQDVGVGVHSVDGRVLSVAADTQRCIERRHLGHQIGDIVQGRPIAWQSVFWREQTEQWRGPTCWFHSSSRD